MNKFITVDAQDYEIDYKMDPVVINASEIVKIEFEWRTLDDDVLTIGDESDRRFFAEKTGQEYENTGEWVEWYDITFINKEQIRAFLINGKHFKSEADLAKYLNNL